jgi:hypothetical protein
MTLRDDARFFSRQSPNKIFFRPKPDSCKGKSNPRPSDNQTLTAGARANLVEKGFGKIETRSNLQNFLKPCQIFCAIGRDERDECGSPQRRRRGIFVEPQPKHNSSPVGATYSDDVVPTELLFVFELLIYKDVSPTGFEKLNPCFIRVHPPKLDAAFLLIRTT